MTRTSIIKSSCAAAGTFLLLAVLSAGAEERFPILKAGNVVYSNVTVTAVTPTDIYISYAGGMDNLKLKDLDPGLQKHFGYNRVKAGETERMQREGNAQFSAEISKKKAAAPSPPGAEVETPRPADDVGDIVVPKLYAKSFRGQFAPQIIVEQWLTPAPDTTGKFVLVDFWATWCGPCRQSIPHLNDLQARFKDRLVVIGLTDESPEKVRAMTSPQMNYSVGTDRQKQTSRLVEVKGIPHAMLIDPRGIVRFEGMPGYLTESGLERLLKKYGS